MKQPVSLWQIKLNRIESLVDSGRISPLDTFSRMVDVLIEQHSVDSNRLSSFEQQLSDFHEEYADFQNQYRVTSNTLAELSGIIAELKQEKEQLLRFIDKRGLLNDYEKAAYKSKMNAVYRERRKQNKA